MKTLTTLIALSLSVSIFNIYAHHDDLFGQTVYKYENVSTNRCLNVHGRDHFNGASTSLYPCANTEDQEWFVVSDESPWVQLINHSSEKCLNVHGKDNRDGGIVTLYDCADTQDQQWMIVDQGDGRVKIRNRSTDRCLNVDRGRDNQDGAPATVYSCANTPDQLWVKSGPN